MPRAQLSISLPSDVWIRDLSTSYDATTFEVVTALAGEDAGIALLRIKSAEFLDILADVRGQPDVVDVDLL